MREFSASELLSSSFLVVIVFSLFAPSGRRLFCLFMLAVYLPDDWLLHVLCYIFHFVLFRLHCTVRHWYFGHSVLQFLQRSAAAHCIYSTIVVAIIASAICFVIVC